MAGALDVGGGAAIDGDIESKVLCIVDDDVDVMRCADCFVMSRVRLHAIDILREDESQICALHRMSADEVLISLRHVM